MKKINNFWMLIFFSLLSCAGELTKKAEILDIDQAFRKGKMVAAKIAIDELLLEDSKNEYAWTMAGHIYTKIDNDSLALIYYNKALSINPKIEEAYTGLGIISRKNEDYINAVKYYNKSIEINPRYAQAYASLLVIYLKQKNFEKAIEVGEKSYQLDKHDPAIMANLSIAYHYDGDTIQRDKFFKLAKDKGYRNIEGLQGIIDGELTIFD